MFGLALARRVNTSGRVPPEGIQSNRPSFREDPCLDAGQAIGERLGVLTPFDPRP